MPEHVFVLCPYGAPPHHKWTAEMQGAGLDIVVYAHYYSVMDFRQVLVSVKGYLTVITLVPGARPPMEEWFPAAGLPCTKDARIIEFRAGHDEVARHALNWAAIGSVPRLVPSVLRDHERSQPDIYGMAYDRARAQLERLEPRPHPDAGSPEITQCRSAPPNYGRLHDFDAPDEDPTAVEREIHRRALADAHNWKLLSEAG